MVAKKYRCFTGAGASLLAGVLGLGLVLGALTARAAGAAERGVTPAGSIKLLVLVDWEGRDLAPYNLAALTALRQTLGDVPLTHLLSPAYFTRAGADSATVKRLIRSAMRPGDAVGLTLGGWKSLVETAGVIFRSSPTFWGETLRPQDCAVDCGLDLPVNIYPEPELDRLFAVATTTLEKNGFGRPQGVLTEGWLASHAVLAAAARAGMRYDFSAVAPELIAARAKQYPLYQWVKSLWSAVTPHTQPFAAPAAVAGLTEIPQSLAALDYLAVAELGQIFDEYVEQVKKEPSHTLIFPLVIYQETASQTVPLLTDLLGTLRRHAAQAGITLTHLTLPGMELPDDPTLQNMPVALQQAPTNSLPVKASQPTVTPPQVMGPMAH